MDRCDALHEPSCLLDDRFEYTLAWTLTSAVNTDLQRRPAVLIHTIHLGTSPEEILHTCGVPGRCC